MKPFFIIPCDKGKIKTGKDLGQTEENARAGVFDRMLDMDTRKNFLVRKETSFSVTDEEYSLLEEYIPTEACTEDIRRLRDGDFFFAPPRRVRLRKKNSNRRRTIYLFEEKESMLMKLMTFVMHDYDHLYTDSLYSFRIGKHISEIFRTISRKGYGRTHWVLKTDIRSFGDSVDPGILTEQLRRLFGEEDPALFRFFDRLLNRGEFTEAGEIVRGSTGAMSGCALTNFFENVYLLDLDDRIRERCDFYCRFADDIAVFTRTEEEALAVRQMMSEVFSSRGLAFNEDKTTVTAPGEAFELLGFRIRGKEFDIAETSLQKIQWKMRHYARKLVRRQQKYGLSPEESQQRMIDRINRWFYGKEREENELSWVDWSFSVLTRADSLRRLDLYAQDCIRFAGSGGKRGNARYRVRYASMQRMGYRPLVHAFYHGYERQE